MRPLAQLPGGQAVSIEEVYSDGYAAVRRIDGRVRWQDCHLCDR